MADPAFTVTLQENPFLVFLGKKKKTLKKQQLKSKDLIWNSSKHSAQLLIFSAIFN